MGLSQNGNFICPECGTETRLEIFYEGRAACGSHCEVTTRFTLFCPTCPRRYDRCGSTLHMRGCGLPVGHEGDHTDGDHFWTEDTR